MSEELQQKLRTQLWTVAYTLRGNMSGAPENPDGGSRHNYIPYWA